MTPAMQRDADRLSSECLSRVVDADPRIPASDLDEEVATGRFPQAMERLRGPFNAVALYEGLLVQRAFIVPFAHDKKFLVRERPEKVTVTESEREFLARNPDVDLDGIAPPAPGQPIGSVEIDTVLYNRNTRTLHLVDVKRSLRRGDSLASLRLASLAIRRQVQVQVPIVSTRLVRLRWFADAPAGGNSGITTRASVDEYFGVAVQATVDHAVRRFREGFAAHLQSLLQLPTAVGRTIVPDPMVDEEDWAADVRAFRNIFSRGGNLGRRA